MVVLRALCADRPRDLVLFVSDLHFDYDPPEDDPLMDGAGRAERDLIACLEHHQPEHVVLLGDLFDAWIEYRDLIPKGLTRLLGLLARWVDNGRRVTILVGNHDPWHRDYMEKHLGFELYRHSVTLELAGHRVRVGHGDQEEYGGISRWQRFIRQRWVHRAYAELLPGGFGQWLARMWSRKARTLHVDPTTVEALRRGSVTHLEQTDADIVVFGHSHQPAEDRLEAGTYVNTGAWALTRTYALLDKDGIRLETWERS